MTTLPLWPSRHRNHCLFDKTTATHRSTRTARGPIKLNYKPRFMTMFPCPIANRSSLPEGPIKRPRTLQSRISVKLYLSEFPVTCQPSAQKDYSCCPLKGLPTTTTGRESLRTVFSYHHEWATFLVLWIICVPCVQVLNLNSCPVSSLPFLAELFLALCLLGAVALSSAVKCPSAVGYMADPDNSEQWVLGYVSVFELIS